MKEKEQDIVDPELKSDDLNQMLRWDKKFDATADISGSSENCTFTSLLRHSKFIDVIIKYSSVRNCIDIV